MRKLSVIELSRKLETTGLLESKPTDLVYYSTEEGTFTFELTQKTEEYFRNNNHYIEIFHFNEEKFKERYDELYLYLVEHNLIKTFKLCNENYETASSYMKRKCRELMINLDFALPGIILTLEGYNYNEDYYDLPDYQDSVEYAENKFRENGKTTVEYTAYESYCTFNTNTRYFPLTDKELADARIMYRAFIDTQLLLTAGVENTLPTIEQIYSNSRDVNLSAVEEQLCLGMYKKLKKAFNILSGTDLKTSDEIVLHLWYFVCDRDTEIDDMWAHKYMLALYKSNIIDFEINEEKDSYAKMHLFEDIIKYTPFKANHCQALYEAYVEYQNTQGYADSDYGEDEFNDDYEEYYYNTDRVIVGDEED